MLMVIQTTNKLNEEHIFNEVQLSIIKTHVVEIRTHWNKSRDAIVAVGTKLKIAKTGKSVTRHMYSQICKECGFSEKNGDKLIAISDSPRITSSLYQKILPVSYGTLYEIATLKDKDFEKAVKDKVINPDCFRKTIESLKKDGSNKQDKDEPKENFKLTSVFIDNSNIDSKDEYLVFRNAVNKALKNVDGVRLDFSSLDSFLEREQKKQKREDVKDLSKTLKSKIEERVGLEPQLQQTLKLISKKDPQKKQIAIVLKKDLFGDAKKPLEQVVHYANTLKNKWKVDWRTYTVGTSIEQKCVGDIPEFNVKIAA